MQLEFTSYPKPSRTPVGASRSSPAQHDSTSQHLAGEEFAQPTRHQNPQMQVKMTSRYVINGLLPPTTFHLNISQNKSLVESLSLYNLKFANLFHQVASY
ncbi:hypothetical protein AVEN_116614-1 [Araneus ventricosus]|uniref:Uncharacterized protein n=1 Tax=Araneus ventricosus TaxID=182803 RepID=A0A4Y2DGI7_ARAVE|nr:hypothetical protein AVEN_116614-1 [Araneus ventricosus]